MVQLDRRLVPARKDLVAGHLSEFYQISTTEDPQPARVAVAIANLRPRPDDAVVADTQLLFGETVNVFECGDIWAWVQSVADGYVGFVERDNLDTRLDMPISHRVATLGSNLYRSPSLKTPVISQLPFAAQVSVSTSESGFACIADDLWVPQPHLVAIEHAAPDWVTVAEMFLGVPYLWGGRSNLGLDCSALIQLARQASGFRCLRDSDMQATSEGTTLPDTAELERGDLLFWKGHVGVMTDRDTLLHANGHHMAVVREPVIDAIDRIQRSEGSPVTRRARLRNT